MGNPNATHLFEVASLQGGYFTAVQARADGYSKQNIAYHVATGRFQRISRGFYRLRAYPALPHEDVIAAWVRVGADRAVVSHETALSLYELSTARPEKIDLTVPHEQRPRHRPALSAVRVHTTTRPFGPGDIVQRFGVRVTSPARTIVDAAEAGTEPEYIVDAVGQALSRGVLTEAELGVAARGRSERVRRLIERALEDARRAAGLR